MENKIDIKNPEHSAEFVKALEASVHKGGYTTITEMKDITGKRDLLLATAFCNGRMTAKIYFEKIKGTYKLIEKLIIESDLNPYELIISNVVMYLYKNSKVKYLTF